MLDTLREWSLMLVITSFVGGISAFVISESNKTMKKYVKFACSVVALAVMAAPIKGLLQEMPEVFKSGGQVQSEDYSRGAEKTSEWILTKSIEDLKSGISNAIYQKFGIKTSRVYIYIKQEVADSADIIVKPIEIEKIRVEFLRSEIYGADSEGVVGEESEKVADEIRKYLADLLECEVIVESVEF